MQVRFAIIVFYKIARTKLFTITNLGSDTVTSFGNTRHIVRSSFMNYIIPSSMTKVNFKIKEVNVGYAANHIDIRKFCERYASEGKNIPSLILLTISLTCWSSSTYHQLHLYTFNALSL